LDIVINEENYAKKVVKIFQNKYDLLSFLCRIDFAGRVGRYHPLGVIRKTSKEGKDDPTANPQERDRCDRRRSAYWKESLPDPASGTSGNGYRLSAR
jgi:hypothetical protein